MSDINEQLMVPKNLIKQTSVFYVFRMSEHPGKICDQVSHADLTTYYTSGPTMMVTGEITIAGNIDHETVVPRVMKDIGFDSFAEDLNSVDAQIGS